MMVSFVGSLNAGELRVPTSAVSVVTVFISVFAIMSKKLASLA